MDTKVNESKGQSGRGEKTEILVPDGNKSLGLSNPK
jgi:hypothetical protein